jgi:hypothetical protein
MRTTVDIQDDLLREAKAVAARSGTTLSAVVSDSLRLSLARRPADMRPRTRLPVYVPGRPGLVPGVDLFDNAALLRYMDEHPDADP